MRLVAREDLALPQDRAYDSLLDIAYLERQLMRRGVDLARRDERAEPGPGSEWLAGVERAGRRIDLEARIVRWDNPDAAALQAGTGGIDARLDAVFTPLSRNATRVLVTLDLTARGLVGRMLLKTLLPSRQRLGARFEEIVAEIARRAEGQAGD